MAFPNDYFNTLASIRAALAVSDQIAKIHSDLARMDETHRAAITQLEFPIESSRRYVEQIGAIEELARSAVTEVRDAQALATSVVADLAAARQFSAHTLASVEASLRCVDTASLIAERLGDFEIARSVDVAAYERLINVNDRIAAEFACMTRGIESTRTVPDLAEFALSSASRELVVANYALDKVTVEAEGEGEEEEEEERSCLDDIRSEVPDIDTLLRQVNPELVRPYQGVKDAANSDSVDRTRHVLASIRELCNSVLRQLAPTGPVRGWVEREGLGMLHRGTPTREARVLYICRRFREGPLAGFFDADVRGVAGTHGGLQSPAQTGSGVLKWAIARSRLEDREFCSIHDRTRLNRGLKSVLVWGPGHAGRLPASSCRRCAEMNEPTNGRAIPARQLPGPRTFRQDRADVDFIVELLPRAVS